MPKEWRGPDHVPSVSYGEVGPACMDKRRVFSIFINNCPSRCISEYLKNEERVSLLTWDLKI